ncbi:flavin reductase family protein [Anaerotalea alkaliphila]|uniref:Flavin reductase family protein n=1 Tax=Anaerotalea alkaliphila TaxID=2662126 RepID=A0A7X5HY31_9FIRM|nr:flavin reductase family protein [Anaerotalea alkaliphila]NDL68769.1 flavin reductase family protein [Anaerotalea alkaliphila]
MSKIQWRPGNMVYPVPAALVSCGADPSEWNLVTVAWTGTACSDPPMTYISLKPSRHSFDLVLRTGEFVLNLTTADMARATDFCGVRSGRDLDKWEATGLTPLPATHVKAPLVAESPMNIECRVTQVLPLGSHHMFLAEVLAVHVDDRFLDGNGKFHLDKADPICYSHGQYHPLGKSLGKFGWSVEKKKKRKK